MKLIIMFFIFIYLFLHACVEKNDIIIKEIIPDKIKVAITLDSNIIKKPLDGLIYSAYLDHLMKSFENLPLSLQNTYYFHEKSVYLSDFLYQDNENNQEENYWSNEFLIYEIIGTSFNTVSYCAIDFGYHIYLLEGFPTNNMNKLIKYRIREIDNDTTAYKVARFASYYNSIDFFPLVIVDWNNYDELKKDYNHIKLPIINKIEDEYFIELYLIAVGEWHVEIKNSILIKDNQIKYHNVEIYHPKLKRFVTKEYFFK